ncbi:3-oxoacyl-ACP synthase III family protein [Natronospora cellulosivora (SeqCode)]
MGDFYFPKNKKRKINSYCKILSTAHFLPQEHISNEDIINKYDLPFKSSTIYKALGVEKRHIADESWEDSDVLLKSAKKCLDDYGISVDDLSKLIVNKYIGDNILPMTASRLQGKLGSNTAMHAFDIDGGISSFLHSLDLISAYINTGDKYIILSSGGIYRRFINKKDPRVSFLFGDASASILFGQANEKHFLASYMYSNYNYYHASVSLSAISAKEAGTSSENQLAYVYDNYHMDNWKIAEDFYRQASMEITKNLFEQSGLKMDEIDIVLVTENNKRIWELTLETIGVSEDKSISLLKNYGNTMSAMLPLLLDEGIRSGIIQEGMNVLMISHGEGMSGGGIVYKV